MDIFNITLARQQAEVEVNFQLDAHLFLTSACGVYQTIMIVICFYLAELSLEFLMCGKISGQEFDE